MTVRIDLEVESRIRSVIVSEDNTGTLRVIRIELNRRFQRIYGRIEIIRYRKFAYRREIRAGIQRVIEIGVVFVSAHRTYVMRISSRLSGGFYDSLFIAVRIRRREQLVAFRVITSRTVIVRGPAVRACGRLRVYVYEIMTECRNNDGT